MLGRGRVTILRVETHLRASLVSNVGRPRTNDESPVARAPEESISALYAGERPDPRPS
jgi:hypothetical protein